MAARAHPPITQRLARINVSRSDTFAPTAARHRAATCMLHPQPRSLANSPTRTRRAPYAASVPCASCASCVMRVMRTMRTMRTIRTMRAMCRAAHRLLAARAQLALKRACAPWAETARPTEAPRARSALPTLACARAVYSDAHGAFARVRRCVIQTRLPSCRLSLGARTATSTATRAHRLCDGGSRTSTYHAATCANQRVTQRHVRTHCCAPSRGDVYAAPAASLSRELAYSHTSRTVRRIRAMRVMRVMRVMRTMRTMRTTIRTMRAMCRAAHRLLAARAQLALDIQILKHLALAKSVLELRIRE